jgi:hypothetical protein
MGTHTLKVSSRSCIFIAFPANTVLLSTESTTILYVLQKSNLLINIFKRAGACEYSTLWFWSHFRCNLKAKALMPCVYNLLTKCSEWYIFVWLLFKGFNFNINWFIDYLQFYVPLNNFSLIWRRHQFRWMAQNFDLCLTLRDFEQAGIFIVQHLLWHGVSDFPVSFEGPPQLVVSYNTPGDVEDLF